MASDCHDCGGAVRRGQEVKSLCLLSSGWDRKAEAKQFKDLEALYAEVVRGRMTTNATVSLSAKVLPPGQEQHTKTKAWRGRITWPDRLRPQAWEEDEETKHIGGLRDVSKSLDLVPSVPRRA